MASEQVLPLFPLQVVLFPGATMPLHIFEPRYRRMVGEAVEQNSEFGMILAEEAEMSSVGCTSVVEQVIKRYEDGRFDIVTRGRQRFQVLELSEEEECLRATIELFQDESSDSVAPAVVEEALNLAAEVAQALHVELPEDFTIDEPQASFAVAAALPLELDFKQQLLEDRSEPHRMHSLVEYLATVLDRTQATHRVQELARTNGHAGRSIE